PDGAVQAAAVLGHRLEGRLPTPGEPIRAHLGVEPGEADLDVRPDPPAFIGKPGEARPVQLVDQLPLELAVPLDAVDRRDAAQGGDEAGHGRGVAGEAFGVGDVVDQVAADGDEV